MQTWPSIDPTACQFTRPEVFLIRNLRRVGIENGQIPGIFWSLKSCLQDNPGMTLKQLNRCLGRFGWHYLVLDRRIFRLAKACRGKNATRFNDPATDPNTSKEAQCLSTENSKAWQF